MWRLRSRRFFYSSLLAGTLVLGLIFDFLIVAQGLGELWFYGLCLFVYTLFVFVLTVIRFDQLDRL